MANVVNNTSWDLSDVLIATPMTLSHVLKKRQLYAPYDINPKIIVLDEVDLFLKDPDLFKLIMEIMKKFATKRSILADENAKR